MSEFNQVYKQLIAYPRMIAVMLRGFVAREWLEQIDFSNLDRINTFFICPEYQQHKVGKERHVQSKLYGGYLIIKKPLNRVSEFSYKGS